MLKIASSELIGTRVPLPETVLRRQIDFASLGSTEKMKAAGFRTKNIWNRDQFANKELQYYADPEDNGLDPFEFLDDRMNIVADRLSIERRPEFAGQPYSSGLISTRGGGLVLRGDGQAEATLQLPPGTGMLPAFWAYPEFTGRWPGKWPLQEVDIMEALGRSPRHFYANMHTRDPAFSESGRDMEQCLTEVEAKDDLTLVPHRFGLRRQDGLFLWLLNGVVVKVAHVPSDLSGPLHFMINLAVGGSWPGDPPPTTPFPARLGVLDFSLHDTVATQGEPAPPIQPDVDIGACAASIERIRSNLHAHADEVADRELAALKE